MQRRKVLKWIEDVQPSSEEYLTNRLNESDRGSQCLEGLDGVKRAYYISSFAVRDAKLNYMEKNQWRIFVYGVNQPFLDYASASSVIVVKSLKLMLSIFHTLLYRAYANCSTPFSL